MDISQYLEIFIEESKEHLQSLNSSLLELEKNPTDKDLINEVFRVAHTLKGMAATMGFKRMNVLTHDMENVLSEIRNDNIKIDASLLDVLFQCLDALEQYVERIAETGSEGENDNQTIIKHLNALLNGDNAEETQQEQSKKPDTESIEDQSTNDLNKRQHLSIIFSDFEKNALTEANAEGYNCYGITIHIAETCVLKSARAFIVFRTLEKLGQVIKSVPSVQDIEDENFDTSFSVFIVTKNKDEEVIKELSSISEVTEVLVNEIDSDFYVQPQKASEKVAEIREQKKEKDAGKSKSKSKPKANRTVRVDIERLDTLMNLVSELIIIKNGLETLENNNNRDNNNINEQIEYLERITTNLHDAVMKVRMCQLNVFSIDFLD